jgi:hypothetical protein
LLFAASCKLAARIEEEEEDWRKLQNEELQNCTLPLIFLG